jgi:hypothetical protein
MSADTEQRLEAALAWAARGVRVLPIQRAGKAPLTRHGLHDASTDPDVLRGWWSRWPGANVAIATGAPGVDVLDVDVRGQRSGWAALRKLRDGGVLPAGAPLARTPSSGMHLYFVGTDQRNGSLHEQQLDFRATGGYVLVPPSYVDTGLYAGFYRWERTGKPNARLDWTAVTDLLDPRPIGPGVHQLRPRPPRQGWDVHTLAAAVEREPKGNRNNLLFWAFCEALRCGYDLRPIAEAALRNPYQETITVREVESTWRQAVKRVTRDGQAGRSPAVKLEDRAVTQPDQVRTP